MLDNDFVQLVTSGVKHSTDNWGCGIICHNPATDQILLAQRTDTQQWATQGGKVEMGESPYEGVIRECREESNVIVYSMKCYDYRAHTAPNGKNWVDFLFYTDDFDWSQMRNQETEMGEFIWVDADEVLDLDLFPPTRSAIERAMEIGLIGGTAQEDDYIPFVECPTTPTAVQDSCFCAYSYCEPETIFINNQGFYWD